MLGTELALVAWRDRPGLKVLLHHGFTNEVRERPRYEKYENLILDKPFRKNDLATRVREVLCLLMAHSNR